MSWMPAPSPSSGAPRHQPCNVGDALELPAAGVRMGLFDFIGDVVGTVASPFTAVIDAGAKLLGLPPVLTDALKVAAGLATGDVFSILQNSTKLLQDLASQPAETEYTGPLADEAYGGSEGWASTAVLTATGTGETDAEELRALQTLRDEFDPLNRDHGFLGAFGDKVITEKELRETAEDPDAPLELKRAARYVLDHPDLLERLSRSRDGGDVGIAPSDVDLALEQARGGASGGPAPAESDELTALRTVLRSFDALNTEWVDGLARDKVLTRTELEEAAGKPETAPSLKRALRYLLDHPSLLDRLMASTSFGDRKGIARNDLQLAIEDATASGASKGSTAPKPSSTASTTSISSTTKKTSKTQDPSLTDILNDKSLSVEEKIELILMVLENRADDQMLAVTRQLDDNDDKRSAKDDRKKVAQLDKVDRDLNFKLERLMKRKEQLSNLLSTMEMKFASMAQTAIANMGR